MSLDKNLREFVELLNSTKVDYLVVGAYAVGFYGHPRLTGDIDFFLAISPTNARAIVDVVNQFGFASLGLTVDDFLATNRIVQIGYPPNRIDLITSIDAVTFDDAWATRVAGDLYGTPANFISHPLLIQNKLATGRPKDLSDATTLRKRRSLEK